MDTVDGWKTRWIDGSVSQNPLPESSSAGLSRQRKGPRWAGPEPAGPAELAAGSFKKSGKQILPIPILIQLFPDKFYHTFLGAIPMTTVQQSCLSDMMVGFTINLSLWDIILASALFTHRCWRAVGIITATLFLLFLLHIFIIPSIIIPIIVFTIVGACSWSAIF